MSVELWFGCTRVHFGMEAFGFWFFGFLNSVFGFGSIDDDDGFIRYLILSGLFKVPRASASISNGLADACGHEKKMRTWFYPRVHRP